MAGKHTKGYNPNTDVQGYLSAGTGKRKRIETAPVQVSTHTGTVDYTSTRSNIDN